MSTRKTCSCCRQEKLLSEFNNSKAAKDGKHNQCRVCSRASARKHKQNNIEKVKRYQKNYYKEKYWETHLEKSYGVTKEQYEEWYIKQEGVCAICKKESEHRLCVDHCHTTEEVRGLLCKPCNLALGNMNDSIETLLAAIEYLKCG